MVNRVFGKRSQSLATPGGILPSQGAAVFNVLPNRQHVSEGMPGRGHKQRKVKAKKLSSIHSLAHQYHSLLQAFQVGEVSRMLRRAPPRSDASSSKLNALLIPPEAIAERAALNAAITTLDSEDSLPRDETPNFHAMAEAISQLDEPYKDSSPNNPPQQFPSFQSRRHSAEPFDSFIIAPESGRGKLQLPPLVKQLNGGSDKASNLAVVNKNNSKYLVPLSELVGTAQPSNTSNSILKRLSSRVQPSSLETRWDERIAEQFKVTEYSPARSPRYSSQSNSQKKLEVVQQPRKPLLKIHKIGKRSQSVVKERERDRSPNRNTIVRRVERTLRRESTKDLLETESEASSMTEQMLAGARLDDAAAAAGQEVINAKLFDKSRVKESAEMVEVDDPMFNGNIFVNESVKKVEGLQPHTRTEQEVFSLYQDNKFYKEFANIYERKVDKLLNRLEVKTNFAFKSKIMHFTNQTNVYRPSGAAYAIAREAAQSQLLQSRVQRRDQRRLLTVAEPGVILSKLKGQSLTPRGRMPLSPRGGGKQGVTTTGVKLSLDERIKWLEDGVPPSGRTRDQLGIIVAEDDYSHEEKMMAKNSQEMMESMRGGEAGWGQEKRERVKDYGRWYLQPGDFKRKQEERGRVEIQLGHDYVTEEEEERMLFKKRSS